MGIPQIRTSPFEASYSQTCIRFWRVGSHREGLEVLAEASTRSSEADYLGTEWALIQEGNHAEFELRRSWALEDAMHPGDQVGWRYSQQWDRIARLFGPHPERHRACLCRWLHQKPYPQTISGGGGSGDAGGRSRRIIADLDWARGQLPARGLSEYQIEKQMSSLLGWKPPEEEAKAA